MTPTEPQFKRKKLLTRPIIKFQVGQPNYVKIEGKIYLGREMKGDMTADGKKKKEPAHLADVIDLKTGELGQIIVAAVVLSVLNEEYPGDSYVGKCFAITKKTQQPGKSYFGYNVEEIEDPLAAETEAVSTASEPTPLKGARGAKHVA
jgi:hypothetical protein